MNSQYFDLQELVCPDVFNEYGIFAWNFFDPRLIVTINSIRDRIGKPVYINGYDSGREHSQRGLRCNQCQIVKDAKGIYLSGHVTGKASDFDVEGLTAQEVRDWLQLHETWWPYPFRLEDNVGWVHLDLYNSESKVVLFNH
jgi:hypothetical protein